MRPLYTTVSVACINIDVVLNIYRRRKSKIVIIKSAPMCSQIKIPAYRSHLTTHSGVVMLGKRCGGGHRILSMRWLGDCVCVCVCSHIKTPSTRNPKSNEGNAPQNCKCIFTAPVTAPLPLTPTSPPPPPRLCVWSTRAPAI